MRLYKAVFTEAAELDHDSDNEWLLDPPDDHYPLTEDDGAPAGWDAHCLEIWGEPRPFRIPSTRPIYRSRSAAQARVNLINRWCGDGSAKLAETETDWLPIAEANARRKAARNATKIARLEAEIARLKESA